MNDQRANCAFARRLLEFVGPAAVVGERVAAEEFGVVGRRVAYDAEDDFALYVDAGVVVPVELRGGGAVADEDDGRVDVGVWCEGLVGDYEVVAELQLHRAALACDSE